MPNPIVNTRTLFGGIVYDSLAVDYFTRAGITDPNEKKVVNTFVLSCRGNTNIWTALQGGLVYLVSPTSYGASLHNLMSSSFLANTTVAPAHSTNGWQPDGVTQFLKTGLIPSTTLTEDSHTTIIYSRTDVAVATSRIFGAIQGATTRINGAVRGNTDLAVFSCYNSANAMVPASTNGSGYFTFTILSSTSRLIRRNGASLGTDATDISASNRPNVEMYLLAQNNAGTMSAPAPYEVAGFIQTVTGLSTADSDTLVTFLQTYNANIIAGGR